MKAEDYITGLLNDDQILTIETTDHAIKIFENCASRAIEPNTTVLLAGASNDDTAEVMAMKAEIAELRAFKTTNYYSCSCYRRCSHWQTGSSAQEWQNYRAQGRHHVHRL